MKFSKTYLIFFLLGLGGIIVFPHDAVAGPFDDVFLKSPGDHTPTHHYGIMNNDGHFMPRWNDFTGSKAAKGLGLKKNNRLSAAVCVNNSYYHVASQPSIVYHDRFNSWF
jgi:hypothetical protein